MQRKKELIKNEKNNENYCFVKKSEKIHGKQRFKIQILGVFNLTYSTLPEA